MIKRTILLLLAMGYGLLTPLYAQELEIARENSTTRSIKDIYRYVKGKVFKQQYYLNEFKINSGNLLWANQQVFNSTHQYYYSFLGEATPILRMVTTISKVADKHYYAEFLYGNQGELIYCYEKQNDRDSNDFEELHAYFENEVCINLMIDQAIVDYKDTRYNTQLKALQTAGKFYAERFIADMKEF